MNYAIIRNLIGKIFVLIAFLLLLPLATAIINSEGWLNIISFIIPIVLLLGIGLLFNIKKAEDKTLLAKEGFVIVALSWILMSLFGCLPFVISGQIPNFVDAFFETTSGFTTTGASILSNVSGHMVEELAKSMQLWRSFTHWIGGMGVLVFILAIIPESDSGSAVHILRAESPGPQVGKLVSKMKVSSRILYIIYIALTLAEFLFLWLGPDKEMTAFSSLIYALGTAGTGGFGINTASMGYYGAYSQYVVAIFMFIFGVNFNMFYFLLIKNLKDIRKNEEIRWYFIIVFASVLIIFFNILSQYNSVEHAFRDALFQTTSIMSTTGYVTADMNAWPVLSKCVIMLLMLFGACAGSTAGGFKVSRIIILIKSGIAKIKKMVSPRKVFAVRMNGKALDEETISGVHGYMIVYFIIFAVCTLLVSIDGIGDIVSNITASISCISNVGPYLSGATGSLDGTFMNYSYFSKIIFSLEMIAGRLELFPMLILLTPSTWKKRSF
ncbi:MAG: TrkH family potassium uptake protein [Bacilli bacterium]|nr:TrkH family potassium uptake protein [Bacilli bacterium]